MSDLSAEQRQALQVAHDLVDMGAPIFSAYPNHGAGPEFHLPSAWQTYRPNHIQVDKWKPGMALAMVTGVVHDVLDVDPRNGGDAGQDELTSAAAWPFVYGKAATPSMGTHYLIDRTHLAKGKPAKGVDLQAGDDHGEGRGFVYIAPTVRVSKFGADKGKPVAYRWVTPPERPNGVRDAHLATLLDMLRGQRTSRTRPPVQARTAADDDLDAFADLASDWTAAEADRMIAGQLKAVQAAREGEVNNALGGAARVLGRFVAGGYLGQDSAMSSLKKALDAGGVHSDSWNVANRKDWTASTAIIAGMANGAKEPWTVERPVVMSTVSVGLPAPSRGASAAPGDSAVTTDAPSAPIVLDAAPGHNTALPAQELPSPGLPMDVARKLGQQYPDRLTWWRGDFYRHAGTHWVTEEEARVRKWVYLATERATYLKPRTKDGNVTFEVVNWAPTIGKVREVMAALGEGVLQRDGDDDRVLALTNGVLSGVQGGERILWPHKPEVFNLTVRPFAYDAEATCPAWLEFLGQVLPGADEDQALLQEWFGHVLSGSTRRHIVLSLAGASRSGKGTILRVLTAMTGTENVAAGRLDTLAAHFGLEPLIGKSLLTFGDVRWANSNASVAIQRMLEISGEDKVTIPRKNKTDWEGTLGVRIMFAGNDMPRFTDPGGAMTNRLRIINFTQSFAGREDPHLTDRLIGELPGIFNWALEGLDRLASTGKFTESARGASLRARVADGGDAFSAFAEEYLEPAADESVWCFEDDVVRAYSEWCERTRRTRDSSTAETIRASVMDAFPDVKNSKHTRKSKRTDSGPRKVRAFVGLRLNAVEPGAEFEVDL